MVHQAAQWIAEVGTLRSQFCWTVNSCRVAGREASRWEGLRCHRGPEVSKVYSREHNLTRNYAYLHYTNISIGGYYYQGGKYLGGTYT